jgi:biopolymer transport protein TolR
VAFQFENSDSSEESKIGSSLAEINIIPLVDIVLVLLLIFMLTAPMMYRGIDVSLPKTGKGSKPAEMEERLILTLSKEQKVYLNEEQVSFNHLTRKIKQVYSKRKDKTLYVKADKTLPYGFIIETMDQVQNAGVKKIGMVTEPKENAGSQ